MSSRPAPQIGFSFEYLMWIFTRLSGCALYLLGLAGFISALVKPINPNNNSANPDSRVKIHIKYSKLKPI